MPLSSKTIVNHIDHWSSRLAASGYAFRGSWPRRLFRHEPLENAVQILGQQELWSRALSEGKRARDIASTRVVNRTSRAHSFVRLYFRPRNPTQYWIEGIRKEEDGFFENDSSKHAPILIMLAFNAISILRNPDVHFSNGNMQADDVEYGATEDFFCGIDFEKVYHFGSSGYTEIVKFSRCAEVLIPDRLPLDGTLTKVFCRSPAERLTLLDALGVKADLWASRIAISEDTSMFDRRFALVKSVILKRDQIEFEIHPRADSKNVLIKLTITDVEDGSARILGPKLTPAKPSSGSSWRAKIDLPAPSYDIMIELEGCVGFHARLYRSEGPL